MATIAASKLPLDWGSQSLTMAYKVVYLAKAYSIPPILVVNNDQTRIHLVPNGGERTWEPKGTKHVQMLGLEDKRQVTMVISFSATMDLLPPQMVFISSTLRTLPPNSKRKKYCINDGWILLLVRIISHP
jgi:hypothetical protein